MATSWERYAQRLGANLKRRRAHLKLTQEEAADRCGVAVRHYQKLEAGQVNLTLRTLVRVSVAMKIDLFRPFETPRSGKRGQPPSD